MVNLNKIVDIHSHILPGIDDGAKNFLDSIEIVRELSNLGVTDIVATPHYVDETIFRSSRENNIQLLEDLKERLLAENINVNVFLGNEIYINEKILDLIEKAEISSLADSNYLLVELPMDEEYPNFEDYLKELINNGYKVVLAHPERYVISQKDDGILKDLFDAGILLQCNTGSIVGKYGKEAQKLIKKLAKNKMIFTFGSDAHHPKKNDYLPLALKKLSKYYNERELKELFELNPRKIIDGII